MVRGKWTAIEARDIVNRAVEHVAKVYEGTPKANRPAIICLFDSFDTSTGAAWVAKDIGAIKAACRAYVDKVEATAKQTGPSNDVWPDEGGTV